MIASNIILPLRPLLLLLRYLEIHLQSYQLTYYVFRPSRLYVIIVLTPFMLLVVRRLRPLEFLSNNKFLFLLVIGMLQNLIMLIL